MKVKHSPQHKVTTIELDDHDLQAATPGTAMHLWLSLGQAILNHGNLPVITGTKVKYHTFLNGEELLSIGE